MEKNYIRQGEYGKRSHLKASFKELLKVQDSSSLEMLAIFVNNNPYNFEFYIAVVYDIPKEEHVEKMIGLFENAGLVLRNDLTFFMSMNSMKDRRFNSCAFLGEQDIDLKFENMFDFVEIEDLKKKGYYMQPFGKEKKKPLFAHRKLKVERVNVFGKNKNVIKLALKSSQGTRIDGMIFEDEDEFREKMGTAKYITCTYYPVINEYQG